MTQAVNDVIRERLRQQDQEGWTPEHDDGHTRGELVEAAACYALHVNDGTGVYETEPPPGWPWDPEWWKPKNPRRDLVRAAALLIAEIDRLDRAVSPNRDAET